MEEPWLSGSHQDVDALLRPLLHSLEQARQELQRWTADLTLEQLWACPWGLAPVGFHLRHLAGSIDRLFTYARGEALSQEQLRALESEQAPGDGAEQLLAALDSVIARVSEQVKRLDPACLREPRSVGRRRLPTTVIGLLVHIAEHTQRHVGQAITTARLVRALEADAAR